MKILKKRAIAILIDSFLFGLLFVFFQSIIQHVWNIKLEYWDLLLFVPFFMKDCVFRNASIGKKIMRIVIYDDNWAPPKFNVLLKRNIMMLTVGYMLFLKAHFVNGNIINFFDWERDVLKTRVIDKRVFQQLSEETTKSGKNLTELYNAYLRSVYLQ